MRYAGPMPSRDRQIGFVLFRLGMLIVLMGLFALFALLWPKYGPQVVKLILPDRLKPKPPVPERVEDKPAAWDPAKESLPPGMQAVK